MCIRDRLYIINHNGSIFRVISGDLAEVNIFADEDELSSTTNTTVDQFQWMLNGEPIDGATASTFTALESGEYALQITSPNGCSYISESLQVISTNTNELSNLKEFTVFPLPFNEELNYFLSFNDPTEVTISLLDQNGKIVEERQFGRTSTINDHFNTKDLSSGVYLLKIKTEKGTSVRKVIHF